MNNVFKQLIATEIGDDFLNLYINSPFVFPEKTYKEYKKPLFRFVVFTDTHFGLDDPRYPVEGTYQNRMNLVVDNLIQEKEERGLDFFVANGDIVHGASQDYASREESMRDVIDNYFSRIDVPYYTTAGNHDTISDLAWHELFNEYRHSSFVYKNYGFILADSSDIGGNRQICLNDTFIEDKLSEYSDKKGVFFFSHIPRFKEDFHPEEYAKPPQCDRIMQALGDASNLILMSSGHFHYEDDIFEDTGISAPLFFNGHVSDYGVDYYGYRIFEVFEDRVVTKQWDMNNQRIVNKNTLFVD